MKRFYLFGKNVAPIVRLCAHDEVPCGRYVCWQTGIWRGYPPPNPPPAGGNARATHSDSFGLGEENASFFIP